MNEERMRYHRELVGRPGSRERIDTPALVLDLDAFEDNVAKMAAFARERSVALRPHAKTHKCAAIAQAQSKAGAIGQCCAKLGEAETLARAGVTGILITSAFSTAPKIERLVRLHAASPDLAIVVEDAQTVGDLASAFAAAGRVLDVLIDVDVGTHRFGVTSLADMLELARLIHARPSLRLKGLQGYAGHVQSTVDYSERQRGSLAALEILARHRDALLQAGLPCLIVSGSGTGTHHIDAAAGILTELQVGSYCFSDVIYDGVDLVGRGRGQFRDALFVYARVVSAQHDDFVTTDAGSKTFAMDGPRPVLYGGAPEGAKYEIFGDEFGRIVGRGVRAKMPIGTLAACVVPHCDPNVNLFDEYLCVRGDRLEAIWPIEARGCSG